MHIHIIQHVPFEEEGAIGQWAAAHGHTISRTLIYDGAVPPAHDNYDWLIVMGGPMSVGDEDRYPWLAHEKAYIREAVSHVKIVIGICLGAQLIASACGGEVMKNPDKEIGFFPVRLTPAASKLPVYSALPEMFTAFHWHGDTFVPPPGSTVTAESDACRAQAFEYRGRVFGLQFHLEATRAGVGKLVTACADELVDGPFIQSSDEILAAADTEADRLYPLLECFLDGIAAL